MRAIEHSVEEEPVIKKARMIDTVEKVPMLSQDETSVDVNKGNEQVPLLDMEEKKEICVASGDGSKNGEKMDEVSALSLADRKHIDPKESRDFEMEKKEVDVVSGDANKEKKYEVSTALAVTSRDENPVIENKDSCVASGGIKEESGSDPLVSGKKLLVLDLNGLLADIVSPLADDKADINIGRRASEFSRSFVHCHL